MAASSQPITEPVTIIRQGDQHDKYRDPFTWSATVRWFGPHAVELMGVDAPVTKQVWRDVMNLMHRLGIKRFLIHRIGNDTQSWRWLKVKHYGSDQRHSSLHDLPKSVGGSS